MKHVAIVNPMASSGGAGELWPGIEEAMKALFPELIVRFTEAPGHATALTRDSLERGAELVVSVGGDGTNNEVLGGFVDEEGSNRFPAATMGVLAAGTGGDFQRLFGRVKAQRQVRRLAEAKTRTIDYGVARFTGHDGKPALRPFLNMASVGVSASVVNHVNASDANMGPTAKYVLGSLRGIAGHRNQQVTIAVDDGPARRVDLTLACIGNGQYFGSGMWVCPMAELDDGLFDVVEVLGMSRRRLVTTLAKVFKGRHLRVKGVETERAESIELTPIWDRAEIMLELDGEQPGRLPARFEVVRHGLKVRVAGSRD